MEENRKFCRILIKRRLADNPNPPTDLKHGELAFDEGVSTLYVSVSSQDKQTGEF